ncbi:MAG: 30S ribosomal protein S2 [Saprospiraceae bacterium]
MDRAANAMKQIARSGKKILFVATKKQARNIVKNAAESVGMPDVTERWLGGMMTNFLNHPSFCEEKADHREVVGRYYFVSITKKSVLL